MGQAANTVSRNGSMTSRIIASLSSVYVTLVEVDHESNDSGKRSVPDCDFKAFLPGVASEVGRRKVKQMLKSHYISGRLNWVSKDGRWALPGAVDPRRTQLTGAVTIPESKPFQFKLL